jgi:hypothetical protein
MGIVRVSKVLDADAELVAPGVWVALALGPKFARSMSGEVKVSKTCDVLGSDLDYHV